MYSPEYDIRFGGIEKLHPFDSRKYSRAWNKLLKIFGSKLGNITVSPKSIVDESTLLAVHTSDYLNSLNNSKNVARALEMPPIGIFPIKFIEQRILRPMRFATAGTLLASGKALESGIGINLGGGYHHAASNHGSGFCIYSDIAIAIKILRMNKNLSLKDQVIIIDLDAHQGNGLERIFYEDRSVHIFDMYNQDIYPNDNIVKDRIDCEIPLNSYVEDGEYLEALSARLPEFLESVDNVKLAFYNAGTDIYSGDILGQLKVSAEGVFKRDKFVFEALTDLKIPWVMTLSGGYSKRSYQLVANSVQFVLEKWC